MRRIISAAALAGPLILATAGTVHAQAPVANFSVAPQPAVRYSSTTFRSTGTCAATPCTYRWFHGDSASTDRFGTGATTTFTFVGTPGARTVTLKVTDRRNRTAARTRTFQMVEPSSPPPSEQCSDGRDNDGDGLTDYPADPGCSSANDNDETNVVEPPPPGGLPGPDNTGVPPGTTLTASGRITVSTAGAVLNGLDVTAQGREPAISVNAPNVTIRNTKVRGNTIALIQNNSTGLVVQDSELINRPAAGQPNCHNGIATGNFTARRLEITGCENGAEMFRGNVVFEGNWIHDLDNVGPSYVFGDGQPHTDGVQLNGGGANVVIRNNNIDPLPQGERGGTSGIIANTAGDNVRIEDNLIDGSGSSYAIYAPRTAKSAWIIDRNLLGRGTYGYTACVRPGNTVTAFRDNRDAATAALINADYGTGGGCSN